MFCQLFKRFALLSTGDALDSIDVCSKIKSKKSIQMQSIPDKNRPKNQIPNIIFRFGTVKSQFISIKNHDKSV